MTRPTIFFDLDGTLTDPKPGITRCVQHALEQLGEPVPPADDLTWCIGPPLQDSFATLVGAGQAAEALRFYRERFSEIGLFENALYPGVTDCLTTLTRSGGRLCLASSKPLVYVERILEHFGLTRFFDGVFGSELDGTRTDKRELLAYALQQTGSEAARSVMVGDREHDIIGANHNGMGSIAVLYGYGSRDELERAGAGSFAESPLAISKILLG